MSGGATYMEVTVMEPRYTHDCIMSTTGACIFLGNWREYDLYYCPQNGIPTVLARYGSNGPDYLSGLGSSVEALHRGYIIATMLDLVTIDVLV